MTPVSAEERELWADFEAGRITPGAFGHADHLRLAHIALRSFGYLDALHRYSTALKTLTQAAGAPQKFNVTITTAFLSALSERLAANPNQDWRTFEAANADLQQPGFLGRWYTDDDLKSEFARTHFMLPARP